VRGVDPSRIGAIVGDLAAVEEIFALKRLMRSLGRRQHRRPPGRDGAAPGAWPRLVPLQRHDRGIEQADAILMIGANPRIEASLLNVRIRKRWRSRRCRSASSASGSI
jgi:NADH-quinone oxidoreductase subunit G